MARTLASRVLAAASDLLPAHLSGWTRAMAREMDEIDDDGAALLFGAGCLRAIFVVATSVCLRSLLDAVRTLPSPLEPWRFPAMNRIPARPRLLGFFCGIAAVGMGIAYMAAAEAPSRYIFVNLSALVLGATAWFALGGVARSNLAGAGAAIVALAVPMLLTALFGMPVEGAARWVSLGPLTLQVSLIVVPAMLVIYARRPDALGTFGMIVAALALAAQPDRAMAGVLLAGLIALLASNRTALPVVAAGGAFLAFGWTLLRPDLLPPAPFVDRILYSSFDIHLLTGLAVLAGAAALILPAIIGIGRLERDRAALPAFGGCWSAAILAAALGNYPTPLVGYGGSAVLGYLLSVALLPTGRRSGGAAHASRSPACDSDGDQRDSELHAQLA